MSSWKLFVSKGSRCGKFVKKHQVLYSHSVLKLPGGFCSPLSLDWYTLLAEIMGDSHETLSGLIWSIPCTTGQVVVAGFVSDFQEKQGFSPHHSETSRASEAHTVRCSDSHQQTATKNTWWSPFLWQKSLLIAVSTYLAENVVSLPFFAFQKMKMSRIIVFSESTRKFFKKRFDMTGWRIFLFIFYIWWHLYFYSTYEEKNSTSFAFVLFQKTLELRGYVGITFISV